MALFAFRIADRWRRTSIDGFIEADPRHEHERAAVFGG